MRDAARAPTSDGVHTNSLGLAATVKISALNQFGIFQIVLMLMYILATLT